MPWSNCIGCPKTDTIILPKYINLPITKIKSGKWEDCLELCKLIHDQHYSANQDDDCNYFNFYTSEFDGDLKNYCNLFSQREEIDIFTAERPMKGVVSGYRQTAEFTGPGKYIASNNMTNTKLDTNFIRVCMLRLYWKYTTVTVMPEGEKHWGCQ